ncbi:cob(I)alamin adenosyltransferase [Deinobacterium chartae]|uniref:Corrinoid adenosyltransferase n=1 Tax=Deinobacterium chartae TaxID=521158 RepID=A0A841I2H9_9DEIO|nr:cob(I)yrinic acid a,c-diamide adenosyltransferase [Deinobacterium chartae]MBB6098548.1 cob(I)alamin adenosyltransferase [Deinobacterium chartae]
MKIYTKTGDAGETGLYGADRVSKAHARVEAYGTVDELNSLIGVARAQLGAGDPLGSDLEALQNALFDVGADLATRPGGRYESNIVRIDARDVALLEATIDRYQAELPELRHFVHPGGTPVAATLHLARAVARRAEREVVRLAAEEEVSHDLRVYLNRLSDLLFVLARTANHRAGVLEEAWQVKRRRES